MSIFVRVFSLFALFILTLYAQKPKLLLLEKYQDQNVTGWVMSEKLDGIRAYWDGKRLLSRGGYVIYAPAWFTKEYPPFAIDGELWSKRADFEAISSTVRDSVPNEEWKNIKHYIFEVPSEGNLSTRLAKLRKNKSPYIEVIQQIPIKSKQHLKAFFDKIIANGGEGVVIRDPKAPYIAERTYKALKYKKFDDAECTVIGYNAGKGKFTGMVGSLTCQLDRNVTFKIGSGLKNSDRVNPPKIGSQVTFKYQGLTKYGKPRFPVFLRARIDK